MIRPNSVRAPPRTNVKSLRVLSCMSCCLFRNEAPSQEENQKTGSENRRRSAGWSIGLNISCTSVCNRAESTTGRGEVRTSAVGFNRRLYWKSAVGERLMFTSMKIKMLFIVFDGSSARETTHVYAARRKRCRDCPQKNTMHHRAPSADRDPRARTGAATSARTGEGSAD